MQRETFIIGNKEFSAIKIAPFQANSIAMKLQKIILPVLGEFTGGGKGNLLDMDISGPLKTLSESLDDKVMTDIVLPMFKASGVICVSENVKVDGEGAINKVFVDADGLADLYELIYEVAMFNFKPFFIKLKDRFGASVGAVSQAGSTSVSAGA